MRKLDFYGEDAFAFHKNVVASKRNTGADPTYKDRLVAMEGILQPLFQNYDVRFNANQLEQLNSQTITAKQREDLLKLYSYQNSVIQKLKIKLTTIEFNKVLSTCQCCTIGEVSSLDHLVPKDEFPEFCVNPKNLFPSCHKCNSYKNVAWRAAGVRTFLNLFLDDLPDEQYLFADVEVDPTGLTTANFEIRNVHGIERSQFALLSSHYANLNLCERFKENSDTIIVSVVNSIKAGRGMLSRVQIVEQILATSRANQEFFGANYWKSVLEIALANSEEFINITYDTP